MANDLIQLEPVAEAPPGTPTGGERQSGVGPVWRGSLLEEKPRMSPKQIAVLLDTPGRR